MADGPKDSFKACALGIAALSILAAWLLRFTIDDAFISFRYALHLAEGHGLLFNIGEPPVEGITNFLWTVTLGGLYGLGVDFEVAAYALSLASFAAVLWLTWLIARRLPLSPAASCAAVAVVGLHETMLTFATSGLETMPVCALTMVLLYRCVVSVEEPTRVSTAVVVSLTGAAAVMLRPDSGIILAFALVVLGRRAMRDGGFGVIAALLLPGAVVGAAWLYWKLQFFGTIIPHTFYVKTGGGLERIAQGGWYASQVVHTLFLYLPLGVIGLRRMLGRDVELVSDAQRPAAKLLGAFGVIWLTYMIWTGGDWMGLRFVVPAIPPLYIVGVAALQRILTAPKWRVAFLVVVVAAGLRPLLLETTSGHIELRNRLDAGERLAAGIALRDAFSDLPLEQRPRVGLYNAGAYAFHSQLPVFDILGLSAPDVVSEGKFSEDLRPGHRYIASFEQLVGHQVRILQDSIAIEPEDIEDPLPITNSVEKRLGASHLRRVRAAALLHKWQDDYLLMFYLCPTDEMTRRLTDVGFRMVPLDLGAPGDDIGADCPRLLNPNTP